MVIWTSPICKTLFIEARELEDEVFQFHLSFPICSWYSEKMRSFFNSGLGPSKVDTDEEKEYR